MGAILVSNKNFIETIKENQRYVAETILSANKETDLPLERIIAITHNALYPVKLTKGIDDLRLSDTEKALLENGIIVFIKQRVIPVGISVVKTDEYYLRVGYQPENNLFRNYAMLLAYAFLFSIVVVFCNNILLNSSASLTLEYYFITIPVLLQAYRFH
jgi:hypothetical protein